MDYDLIIIGAGWAGFNAAQVARVRGFKVCVIEKAHVGGTCLNSGCIPTKALIQSAKVFSLVKKSQNFGVEVLTSSISLSRVQERKSRIVQQLGAGMQFLLKGTDFYSAEAELLSNTEVRSGQDTLKSKYILLATGSSPIELPQFKFDGKKIISSDDILNLKETPRSLLIIGGGVIGCEFASLFSVLGSQVSLVEKMPQLLPGEDPEIAKKLEINFKKKGIKVTLDTDASALNLDEFDLVLICVGRVPCTDGLGLEKVGVALEGGRIIVDDYLKTSVPNIYAAGDCTGKVMLAHYAAYQGKIAAKNIINNATTQIKADNAIVPNCIFTDPEIASVGLNESNAIAMGIELKIDKFDFIASGMARIIDEAEGLIKIISNKSTNEIIGASIIGPRATELISVLTLAVSARLKTTQIKEMIFAHPTLSEAIGEAIH
ncbi:MAG: dihydrolipoyl dehydrogenase [Candidatus Omnitrophica bacterium]|nr:dihydrolipoyl dehydrogenase [Candidatus Omnitrophota bacterium]MBU1869671.1 dihydrolipoyl dehydrogenase [Candidatus Omnitrophota bacterium]